MKKMTVREKRVAIARDVIKQLKEGLIEACHSYVVGDLEDMVGKADPLKDVRDLIKGSGIKKDLCKVCAKGAVLVAHILRFDKMNVEEYDDATAAIWRSSPVPYFTDNQFNLIERLYERRVEGINNKQWREFYDKISDLYDAERIVAIMKEIIRRKGVM